MRLRASVAAVPLHCGQPKVSLAAVGAGVRRTSTKARLVTFCNQKNFAETKIGMCGSLDADTVASRTIANLWQTGKHKHCLIELDMQR